MWALTEAMEWRATDDECATLVAGAGPAIAPGPLVVILAANVTTAALRALGCAVARCEDVVVHTSSRDSVLAKYLVHTASISGLRIEMDRTRLPWTDPRAHMILYGSSETANAVRQRFFGTLEVHGPGAGMALLTDDDGDDAMRRLADDVAAFDQRGCLSPGVALHIGRPEHGEALSALLFSHLQRLGSARPIGVLRSEELAVRALCIQTSRLLGRVWSDASAAVAHQASCGALELAPVGRVLTICTVDSVAAAEALAAPMAPMLSALGCDRDPLRSAFLPGYSLRRSHLGAMQKPAFDGPVDKRPHSPYAAANEAIGGGDGRPQS